MPRRPRPTGELLAGGLTGVPPQQRDSTRHQITELGGVKAVAQAIGRSVRTVQRWAHQGRVPARGGAADTFGQALAGARDQPSHRQAQIGNRRESRMRNHGARLKFSGIAGPLTDSPGSSIKRRNLDFRLSGAAMSDILDAFIDRGEQAGLLSLGDALAAEYMGSSEYGWAWRDDAKTLSFLRHNSD